ncbi:unnamed protein product [Chrysoparadoxa australica]
MVIGTKPKCATLASERYRQLPLEGRAEKLRPHLCHYDLFPPRRDPRTAPIRMEELRALVRKWNLHHERHFWRNHNSKDDVVMALIRHIKKEQVQQDSAVKQKAKREEEKRRQYGAPFGGSTAWNGMSSILHPIELDYCDAGKENILIPIDIALRGDRKPKDPDFGEGMVIMSRRAMGETGGEGPLLLPLRLNKKHTRGKGEDRESNEVQAFGESAAQHLDELDGSLTSSTRQGKLRAQQKCSLAMLNMTQRDQMSKSFLEGFGLLQPLLELIHLDQDLEVLYNCMACVVNILTERYKVTKLIESGVVPVLKTMAAHEDERVQQYTAISLFIMTTHSGIEEWLVQDGAVAALNLLLRSPNIFTTRLGLAGLVNLSMVMTASKADATQRTVIKSAGALMRESSDHELGHFCAVLIHNLTVLESIWIHLDDSAAAVCMRIAQSLDKNHSKTMAICSSTLYNVLPIKKCRSRMVSMGIVELLRNFMLDASQQAKNSCTMLLAELAKYRDVSQVLLEHGLISLFTANIGSADARAVAVSAAGLSNLTTDPSLHGLVLSEEGVLEKLLQALLGDHRQAKHHILQLLCSLVSNKAMQGRVIEAGIVEQISQMQDKDKDEHSAIVTAILFNISCEECLVERLYRGSVDIVSMLVGMVCQSAALPTVQGACLGTMQNLSRCQDCHLRLLEDGVMDALDAAKSVDGGALSTHCASVLYNLSLNHDVATKLVELGAIYLITELAKLDFSQTKRLCAASLCNITLVKVIADNAFLQTVVALSNSNDSARVLSCAKTLANVSAFPRGRVFLGGDMNVVPALIVMMRSGVKEAALVQYYCAVALCNVLSVFLKEDAVEDLVENGNVHDIVAITVLRVNEVPTKEVLGRAIFNLLARSDTRPIVVAQDTVFTLVRLSKLQSAELNQICIRALRNLTCEMQKYEDRLLEIEAEKALIEQSVMSNGGSAVKEMCAAALANISFSPKSARKITGNEQHCRCCAGTCYGEHAGNSRALRCHTVQRQLATGLLQDACLPRGQWRSGRLVSGGNSYCEEPHGGCHYQHHLLRGRAQVDCH